MFHVKYTMIYANVVENTSVELKEILKQSDQNITSHNTNQNQPDKF